MLMLSLARRQMAADIREAREARRLAAIIKREARAMAERNRQARLDMNGKIEKPTGASL